MVQKKPYAEKIRSTESSLDDAFTEKEASRAKKFLDKLLPIALITLGAITAAFFLPVGSTAENTINYLNYALIIYFGLRLIIEFKLSSSNHQFLSDHWTDFVLLVPAFSLLREVKIFQAASRLGIVSLEGEALASSAALSRLGMAGRISRITKIVKKSIGL